MDRKNLLVTILILVVGIGSSVYYKKFHSVDAQADQQQEWPEWQPQSPPSDQPPQTPPAQPQHAEPKSYKEALEISKATGKNVVLFFHADWCSQCKKMEPIFADPKVKAALASYVFYSVDTDREKDVTRQYAVRAIPAYKIVSSVEKVLKDGAGSVSADEFLAWLGTSPKPGPKIPDFTPRDRIDRATPNDPLDPLTPKDNIDDFLKRE